ncbi:MAG: hypothetical protein M1469_02525 [Bacteroidetes bacterium]|nr:hypothetical protein [Bacteroidota bacterium]
MDIIKLVLVVALGITAAYEALTSSNHQSSIAEQSPKSATQITTPKDTVNLFPSDASYDTGVEGIKWGASVESMKGILGGVGLSETESVSGFDTVVYLKQSSGHREFRYGFVNGTFFYYQSVSDLHSEFRSTSDGWQGDEFDKNDIIAQARDLSGAISEHYHAANVTSEYPGDWYQSSKWEWNTNVFSITVGYVYREDRPMNGLQDVQDLATNFEITNRIHFYLQSTVLAADSLIQGNDWSSAESLVNRALVILEDHDSLNYHLEPTFAEKIAAFSGPIARHKQVEQDQLKEKIVALLSEHEYDQVTALLPKVKNDAGGIPDWLLSDLHQIPPCQLAIPLARVLYQTPDPGNLLLAMASEQYQPTPGQNADLLGTVLSVISNRVVLIHVGNSMNGNPMIFYCNLPSCKGGMDLFDGESLEVIGTFSGRAQYRNAAGSTSTVPRLKVRAFTTDIFHTN